jgi:WD40 repeat protein
MAWPAIDRFVREWLPRRKDLLVGVVGVAVEEMAAAFPGGSIAVKLVGELAKHGVNRLLDRKADIPEIKPAGQPFPPEQLDEINTWLERMTVVYTGLLDQLDAMVGNAWDQQQLASLIRETLRDRADLQSAFAAFRDDVQGITFSVSRIEVELGQFHAEFREFIRQFPEYQEFQQLPTPAKQALLQSARHLVAGQAKEAAKVLIGSLSSWGIRRPTVLRIVEATFPAETDREKVIDQNDVRQAGFSPKGLQQPITSPPSFPRPHLAINQSSPPTDPNRAGGVRCQDCRTAPICSLAFSRKGKRLFSADRSGTVMGWEISTGRKLFSTLLARVNQNTRLDYVAFLGGGQVVYADWGWGDGTYFYQQAIGEDRHLRTTPRAGFPPELISRQHSGVALVVFSSDGEKAVTANGDTVRLWNIARDREERRLNAGLLSPKHKGRVSCVALSLCGKFAATGGEDRTVRLWELSTGRQVCCWEGHTAEVTCIVFVPDAEDDLSQRVLSGCEDGSIRLWECRRGYKRSDGQLVRIFLGHSAPVRSLACTPNGHRFLSGSGNALSRSRLEGTVERAIPLMAGTSRLQRPQRQPEKLVMVDCSVRLWDVLSDKEQAHDNNYTAPVTSVACSPNGRWAASGCNDGTVRIWRFPE